MDTQKLREKLHEFLNDRTDEEIQALALVLDVRPDYGGLSKAQFDEAMKLHEDLHAGRLETVSHEQFIASLRQRIARRAA